MNWNPLNDTVPMSFPYLNTVLEIDRGTGAILGRYGDVDIAGKTLKEKWIYREGDEYAMYMGEAHKVQNGNGNVLANYGTGGVIKEMAPNKQTAWCVKWDAPFSDDQNNKMVGHCTLLDDLYALNRGPE